MQEVNKGRSDKFKVCAVVVTYNRKELLRECLQALLNQTRPVDEIIVIDNASTDGTNEMVVSEFPQVTYVRLPENIGGAGGFHEGMKLAYEKGYDWIWVMDDDTIPNRESLLELEKAVHYLSKRVGSPLMLASRVEWTDGTLHPMNIPVVKTSDPELLFETVEMGYLSIRSTSFVSLLVNHRAVAKYGLPIKDYFLWNDDVEYSARVLKNDLGVIVPKSVVVHKTEQKYTPLTAARPERFYYEVRNKLWLLYNNAFSSKEKAKVGLYLVFTIMRYAYKQKFRPHTLYHILRGLKDGFFRRPLQEEQ